MSQQLRGIVIVVLLIALFGEGYFAVSTQNEISFLRYELAWAKQTVTMQTALYRKLASDARLLEKRTSDMEVALGKESASFKANLAKAEKDRQKLESAIGSEERARRLAEATSKVASLQASTEIAALQQQLTTSISSKDLSQIVETWRPRIVKVECRVGGAIAAGSGIVMHFSDIDSAGVGVLTNRHVLYGGSDFSIPPSSCDVLLPGSGTRSTVFAAKKEIEIDRTSELDFGRLVLTDAGSTFRALVAKDTPTCTVAPKLGDGLIILGYPTIGTSGDITATDGIISGIDGSYYITSAKVERGNSGGAAILVKDNCLLGIPTFVRQGSLESLARILDIRAIAN